MLASSALSSKRKLVRPNFAKGRLTISVLAFALYPTKKERRNGRLHRPLSVGLSQPHCMILFLFCKTSSEIRIRLTRSITVKQRQRSIIARTTGSMCAEHLKPDSRVESVLKAQRAGFERPVGVATGQNSLLWRICCHGDRSTYATCSRSRRPDSVSAVMAAAPDGLIRCLLSWQQPPTA